jgi:hypothetical protein
MRSSNENGRYRMWKTPFWMTGRVYWKGRGLSRDEGGGTVYHGTREFIVGLGSERHPSWRHQQHTPEQRR